MMKRFLFFTIILFIGLQSKCNAANASSCIDSSRCMYGGRAIIKNSKKYELQTVLQLGEFYMYVTFIKCKITDDTIELHGLPISPLRECNFVLNPAFEEYREFFEPLPEWQQCDKLYVNNIPIFLCTRKDKYCKVERILALTDKNGFFTIRFKRKDSQYLILKQDERIGIYIDIADIMRCPICS